MKCRKPKKNTGMLVLLGILAAVLLILVVMTFRLSRKSQIQESQETTESSEEESTQAAVETTTAETIQEETESETREEAKQDGYIIIGDSHVVVTDGLGYGVYGSAVEGVVYNENLFFVHTGLDPVMGTFEWLKGDGTAQIQTIIEEHPQIRDWNIISIHGTSMVTMPDIAARYIDNYEKWINDTFSRYHVYMVSIPPLDEKASVYYRRKMPDWAKHCSKQERVAEDAERDTDALKKVEFMEDKVGQIYEGIISGVTNWGIYVELPNTIEGMVALSQMDDDYYEFDEKKMLVFGKRTKKSYRLGDKVVVSVAKVDRMMLSLIHI